MSKKFGKLLLFSAVAGAAAYGAYHYFQKKDNTPSSDKDEDTDDDFDDFSEDLDEDTADTAKERSYVSLNINLDKAEALASDAFHKAKEVIADSVQQVKDTVKSVKEGQSCAEGSFTDLTAVNKEKNAEASQDADASEEPKEEQSASESSEAEDVKSPSGEGTPAENTSSEPAEEKVEEFYSDDV